MIRDNLWFQLMFFLFSLFSGVYCIAKGKKKGDIKIVIVGFFLLTGGWIRAVWLLERFNFNPIVKNALSISELIVTLGVIIAAAIYVKKWRPYIIGLGILLLLVIGVAYLYVSDKSPKISIRTSKQTMQH